MTLCFAQETLIILTDSYLVTGALVEKENK